MSMSMIRIGLVCCCLTRSEEHTSELQSPNNLVCRLLLEKKKTCPRYSRRCAWGDTTHDSLVVHTTLFGSFRDGDVVLQTDDMIVYRSHDFIFFNDTAPTEIYALSLHDALPISALRTGASAGRGTPHSVTSDGAIKPM